jgi:replicative DNA helicase
VTDNTHYSQEAEEAVIYSAMSDAAQAADLTRQLSRRDLFVHEHVIIWGAIEDMVRRGTPVDVVTLTNELQLAGLLVKAGGASRIGSLYDRPVLTKNASEYADIVVNAAQRRRLRKACEGILTACSGPEKISKVLGDAEEAIMAVGRTGEATSKPEILGRTITASFDVIQKRMEAGTSFTGLQTGYGLLDHITGGFQPGNLILLAARPSMGKTALALNIASNACLNSDARIAFFSLEMSRDEVTHRILSSEALVDSSKLRSGLLNTTDWELLGEATSSLAGADLFIDETGGLSHGELRSRCHGLTIDKPLDLVIVDYIQLMRMPSGHQNRNIEVGVISAALKGLAKELKCPILALSQLSRAAASTDTTARPALHHLRDSGSLEQDADIVMFMHRPEMMGAQDREGMAELIIAKHRNGALDTIDLRFMHQYTKFVDPPSF